KELGYQNVINLAGGYQKWVQSGLPVVKDVALTPDQLQRYSRHFLLPQVGDKGQRRLLRSRVLLIGAGGLGSPTALYLAAAAAGPRPQLKRGGCPGRAPRSDWAGAGDGGREAAARDR